MIIIVAINEYSFYFFWVMVICSSFLFHPIYIFIEYTVLLFLLLRAFGSCLLAFLIDLSSVKVD